MPHQSKRLKIDKWPPRNMIYIYIIRDPRNHEIRYVGQTEQMLSKRLSQHLAYPKGRLKTWFAELRILRLRPLIEAIHCVKLKSANFEETQWIHLLAAQGKRLLNTQSLIGVKNSWLASEI